MPVKKITQCLPSTAQLGYFASKHLNSSKKSQGNSLTSCLVYLVLIIYSLTVSYRVYDEVDDKFTVSEDESKKCLVDFQEKKCNALKMEGECSRLYSCVQKEKQINIVIKSWSICAISINQIKDSALFPAVAILMLLVYQIAKTLKKREEIEEHDE